MVLGCGSHEPGDEGGSEGGTTDVALRGEVAAAPVHEDIAAPLGLRVGAESRTEIPLIVFSPAQLSDESSDGVLLVIGGELTAKSGWLRGVEEASVEEVDGTIEVSPETRAGRLPKIPLEQPWTDVGRAVSRLSRVTASVEQLELTGYDTALWVVRGRVRVLPSTVVVSARDYFWEPELSRILIDGEDEAPLTLKAAKPRPPGPPRPGKPGPRPGSPRGVGTGGHGPGGDPPAAPAGGAFGSAPVPTGPSGQVPAVLWPVWPNEPRPAPFAPGAPSQGEEEDGGVPAGPAGAVVLLGELPPELPPAPEAEAVGCNDSSECPSGQRCLIIKLGEETTQTCSDQCADGYANLCVDSAGCCDIDLVCTEAGTCKQPGTSDGEDDGGGGSTPPTYGAGGCGDDNGCSGGCDDSSSGCGNGFNNNNNGCGGSSGGGGCGGDGRDASDSGCGGGNGGSSGGSSGGCGGGSGSSGGSSGGCSGSSGGSSGGCSGGGGGSSGSSGGGCGGGGGGGGGLCTIDRPRPPSRGGGWALSAFYWLSVFLVVRPRRRRVVA